MLRKGVLSVAAAACLAAAMLPGAALAQRQGLHPGGGSAIHVSGASHTGGGMRVNAVRSGPIHGGAVHSGVIHTGGVHVSRSGTFRTAHLRHDRIFVRPGFRHHHRIFVRSAVVPAYYRSCWRWIYRHHHWRRVWVCGPHGWWRHHHRHWRHWY
jgi:hypothetical protein